jgi:lipoate-protein ligase A
MMKVLKISKELTDVKGFLNVREKQKEIGERLGKIVSEDEHLKEIADSLEELMRYKGYDQGSQQ